MQTSNMLTNEIAASTITNCQALMVCSTRRITWPQALKLDCRTPSLSPHTRNDQCLLDSSFSLHSQYDNFPASCSA